MGATGTGYRNDVIIPSRGGDPWAPQRAPDGAPVHYERHRPEHTTLYRLVQQHAASFIAHTEASAKVGRCLRRLHAHGLIAKMPRTRRWRVTDYGRNVIGTTMYLRAERFASFVCLVAAFVCMR